MSEAVHGDEDPWHHQRELARSLVRTLGFEEAVDACQRNSWHGVLKVLLEEAPTAA